jgi:hypothetical protein
MEAKRQYRVLLVAIWLAFLSRGLFYCVQQPMWEGYDEWAHFAFVQHIAELGTLPSRADLVSPEVQRSLHLAPLSLAAAKVAPGTITHDSFWRLAPGERRRREEGLRRLNFTESGAGYPSLPARQYEAQQPPLYYLVLTPPYLMVKRLSLPAQVLALRVFSVVIASSVVFVGYAIALYAMRDRAMALLVTVLLACLPGLFINVCRIGNESLSIALTSAVILFSLKVCRRRSAALDWFLLGTLTGAALLTKAYNFSLVPLLAVVALIRAFRYPKSWKLTAVWCGTAYVAATATAGWWYWRNWIATGTLSGEQLDVAAAGFSIAQKLSGAYRMDWRAVVDAAAFSHIWLGGWSFLVVRSWMYRVCEFVAVFAAIGLSMYLVKTVLSPRPERILRVVGRPPAVLAMAYILMCFAVAYHSLVTFLAHHISTALGWYLYSVVVPEIVLLGLGFTGLVGKKRSQFAMASVCLMSIALDLYTVHFLLMPYYAGMIGHRASGSLEVFRVRTLLSQMGALFRGLSINEATIVGPGAVAAIWGAYVCSTLGLASIAVFIAYRRRNHGAR